MADTTKPRRWATVAAVAAGTALWGVGFIPAPAGPAQPYTTAYGDTAWADAGGGTQPTRAPATTAVPAAYGNAGLAAEYADQLGHDSTQEACEAGITWTCDVTHITPATTYDGTTATKREVFVQSAPMDGDAVAAEFLAASPAGITTIVVKDTSSFLIVDVGSATRSKSKTATPTPTATPAGADQ